MKSLFGLSWVLLSLLNAPLKALPAVSPFSKPVGALILGQGTDKVWDNTFAQIRKRLSAKYPLEIAIGDADAKGMQRALDSLAAAHVHKIVVVPITLSSMSLVMQENYYLLGLLAKPPTEAGLPSQYRMGYKQTEPLINKIPLVMMPSLQDDSILAELLAARLKTMTRQPAKESAILVIEAASNPKMPLAWKLPYQGLMSQVQQMTGLKTVDMAGLLPEAPVLDRDRARNEFQKQVHKLHGQGTVLVLPLELSPSELSMETKRATENTFVRFESKPLLPDPKIVAWVEKSVSQGAAIDDMRIPKKYQTHHLKLTGGTLHD